MEQHVSNFMRPMIKQMMRVTGVGFLTERSIPILIHRLDILRPDLIETFTNECAAFCFRETLQEALVEMVGSCIIDEDKNSFPAVLTDKQLSNRIYIKLGATPCNKENHGSMGAEFLRLKKEGRVKGI